MTHPAPITARIIQTASPLAQMKHTIRLIGQTITKASRYLPIRNHAAALATGAAPKDYFGQVRAIYDDFVKRWRYVRDIHGLETVVTSPEALYQLVMGANGGIGRGLGAGDCDDASIAIGAQLQAIGIPIRLATTTPARGGRLFNHVFVQAKLPDRPGWLTVDPVGHPAHRFGWTAPHGRIAFWDLQGNVLGARGMNPASLKGSEFNGLEEGGTMQQPQYFTQWQDYGLAGIDPYTPELPTEYTTAMGVDYFGAYLGMGFIDGPEVNLLAEVQTYLGADGQEYAVTPMIDLAAEDWNYVRRYGTPYDGMIGLGDDGSVFEYQGDLGFFKRLKKLGKKVFKKARSIARAVVKKLPGGKYLLKIHDKILAVSMKLVKPLTKFVGKYAAKLAPIAALIPGYGPAVSAALMTAGKVSGLMNKYGVNLIGPPGKARSLKFKSPKQHAAFTAALKAEAAQVKAGKGRTRKPGADFPSGPKRPKDTRHLKKGTPEHSAALRSLGVRAGALREKPTAMLTRPVFQPVVTAPEPSPDIEPTESAPAPEAYTAPAPTASAAPAASTAPAPGTWRATPGAWQPYYSDTDWP